MIDIAIAYVDEQGQQHYQELSVPAGTTIINALRSSGVLNLPNLPNLAKFTTWCNEHLSCDTNHKAWYVGIYSQKVRLDTVLNAGDRIEIYRPLTIDPMAKRKSKSKVKLKKLGYRPL